MIIIKPILGSIGLLMSCLVLAQDLEVDPNRFAGEIAAFAAWDKKNSVPEDAFLLIGSSSIRMWPSATAFPDRKIINRGFGGSHISDVNHFFDQLVAPYKPKSVFLYAGDNDIGSGKSAERVLKDFAAFVAQAEATSADMKVYFLSIKPSDARWQFWPEMRRANMLVETYASSRDSVTYVDMASTLLNINEEPKDVFIEDGLHLNSWGYELWAEALRPYLD